MFFDDEVGQSARDRFSEALAHIMLRWKDPYTSEERKPGHPFFHTFASSLRYVETDGFERGDGKKDPLALAAVGFAGHSPVGRLYINPDNFLNLDIRQASGLVVHEILHIVYDHLHYEQARTHPKIWNIATDCTINQQVVAMGYALPEGKGILTEDMEHEVRCINPTTLGDIFKCKPPKADENALFYFDWLLDKMKEEDKKQGPCPSCKGTGKQEKKDDKCKVHPDGKPEKGDKGDSGDQGDQGDKGNQPGQDGQEGDDGDQGQKGKGQSPGDGGDPNQEHGHGDSGEQCTCKDHSGKGEDGEGEGQGQGQDGQHQPGSQGQGGGSGQTEPCDCCQGSGQGQPGGTLGEMLDELNGMTNHSHWDDLTPEEKEIIRRFEAQATQAAKQHHDGTSGLPGDIAGQIANKVKALEPEIDLNCRSIKTV